MSYEKERAIAEAMGGLDVPSEQARKRFINTFHPQFVLGLLDKAERYETALKANKEEATLRWTGQTKFAKAGFEAIVDTCVAALNHKEDKDG